MTIAYEVTGDGPPVLLVHEGVADRRMWRGQVPVLAREWTVVAVDLRGFGDSPHASSGPFEDVDHEVRELVRTMQRHAFELPEPDPWPEEAKLDPPASARLGEIRVPTLVIVGDEDVEDFQRIAELVAAGIPGARLVVIRDAAHVVALERTAEFNEALLAFLRDPAAYTSSQ